MTEDYTRIRNGLAITRFQSDKITYDEENECWSVPSQTNIGKTYEVFHSNRKGWICTCMDYVQNVSRQQNRKCKHIWAVAGKLRSLQQQEEEESTKWKI